MCQSMLIWGCSFGFFFRARAGAPKSVRSLSSGPGRPGKTNTQQDTHKYIGKPLTVRYQPHTNQADQEADTGIPRFPVGIDVRDYE